MAGTREIIHKTLIGSRDVMDGLMGDLVKGNQYTEDEVLHRYAAIHRGNPRGMVKFVLANAPPGTDPMQAWHSYESAMEKKLAERGQRMLVPGYLQRGKQNVQ